MHLVHFITFVDPDGNVDIYLAQQYRHQAKRCAEATEKASTEREKAAWLRLAEEWLKTALTVEWIGQKQRGGY